MRLVCWNVNGLRAIHKKGFLDFLREDEPDILCVQEVKADMDQLPEDLVHGTGYHFYLSTPDLKEDKGWSGVGLYSRIEPRKVEHGFGAGRFDSEGRTILAHYDDFVLMNIYFPNGKASKERLEYKLDFYEAFLKRVGKFVRSGREVVVCGDVNTAHKEIDLARPKENGKISGFLPQERTWLDRFEDAGLIDTYRVFDPSPNRYTWWDIKTRARERNVGWRIDYFYITPGLRKRLKDAFILSQVQGSDHCPVGIVLK